jgi:two-component system OmpR family sensor kinase
LREIEAALKNLGQLSEKLLQLSRLETGFARSDTVTDLLPALKLVVRDFQSSSKIGDGLELVLDADALRAPINVDAFAIAVTNLVQNAIAHGDPYQPIVVAAEAGNTVSVTSAGPVVPAAVLEKLGAPFQRGLSQAQGSGLGLSIVRSIMEQIGGSLTLRSPAAGAADGFQAILHLPEGDNQAS